MMQPSSPQSSGAVEESNGDSPGVPGFHTWRGVYWFVLGFFVAVVVMLTLFTRALA